ncbi:hypothetical protein FTO70_04325 [Methanosarcina sp. KYL-1]|uniref:DUF7343 domain-containing protein n=1 Tax=Methanosarcina sp. KYL-1 TaxID=2602068 RepID=UPI002100B5E6|nr:hypothetical protein [Methanosarcina sp. KYL-1]MCQ1534927.1 hypothetical protein [Methanosarcina sp. KYL-1]
MNLRLYIICIAAALMLAGPAAADIPATIHGVVYGWDTFDPLDNAVVEVNSTPSQSMVAKYGLYSFELASGDYTITASYYQNSTLTYQAEETITIEGEGNYVLDLLLLPVYSEELMDSPEAGEVPENQETGTQSTASPDKTADESPAEPGETGENASGNEASFATASYLLGALLLTLLLAGGYKFSRKQKSKEEIAVPVKKEAHRTETAPGPEKLPSGNLPEPQAKTPETNSGMPEQEKTEEIREMYTEPEAGMPEFRKETEISEPIPEKEITGPGPKIEIAEPVPEKEITEPGLKAEIPEPEPEKEITEPGLKTEITGPVPEKKIPEALPPEPADTSAAEPPAPKKPLPLPADLQEIMDIIRGQGGRITQKDLRSRLKYSEGKVSLMLADLERRELIEKFKRGRGNVVILRDEKK